MKCPHCESDCAREEVDIGVGIMTGPWGCPNCGWSDNPVYDCREGIRKDGDDRVLDQYGVSHHVTREGGLNVLAGGNVANRGDSDAIRVGDVILPKDELDRRLRTTHGCKLCGGRRYFSSRLRGDDLCGACRMKTEHEQEHPKPMLWCEKCRVLGRLQS